MPARCLLCSKKCSGIRTLMHHFLDYHSKFKIAKQLILRSVANKTKFNKNKKIVLKRTKTSSSNTKKFKTDTLYLNDGIHILCGRNDIIIGDGRSTLSLLFPFNKSRSSKKTLPSKVKNGRTNRHKKSSYRKPSTSSTTSSEESIKRFPIRYNCGRHSQYYRINISKLSGHKSLNERTGDFYICNCREKYIKSSNIMKESNLKILTSDTESASSDTGRDSVFCMKCGNGYKNTIALKEHMKIHERHCWVCDEIFPNEHSFKAHIQDHIFKVYACHYRACAVEFPFKELLHRHLDSHVEDEILDGVLDMEEDYNIEGYNRFKHSNHQESINSIVGFLSDTSDLNNCFSFDDNIDMHTIFCDICYEKSLLCDYESHLRNVHYVYSLESGSVY